MKIHSACLMCRTGVLLATLSICTPAVALDSDRDAPVAIDADTTDIDFRTGTRTVSGNVDITQGSMNIRSPAMKVSSVKSRTLTPMDSLTGTSSLLCPRWTHPSGC